MHRSRDPVGILQQEVIGCHSVWKANDLQAHHALYLWYLWSRYTRQEHAHQLHPWQIEGRPAQVASILQGVLVWRYAGSGKTSQGIVKASTSRSWHVGHTEHVCVLSDSKVECALESNLGLQMCSFYQTGQTKAAQTLLLGITLPGLLACMPCRMACATASLFGVYKMSQQGGLMYKSSSQGRTAPISLATVCSCRLFSAPGNTHVLGSRCNSLPTIALVVYTDYYSE